MGNVYFTLLGASVGAAVPLIFNTIKELCIQRNNRKNEEKYIIVQLVFIIDKYISDCDFLASNDGIYSQESKSITTAYDKPELKLSAVKGEFKYLTTDMLYRLYSIESKHLQVIRTLSTLDEDYYLDAPTYYYYFAKRRELYANHGLYVIELSEDICKKFNIRHTSWEGGDNPAESIKQRLIDIRKLKSAAALRGMENSSRSAATAARKLAAGSS